MRDAYGVDYPWAIVLSDGKRLPLMRVRRFSRDYGAPDLNHSASLSRFHDGSATISVEKLRRQWPSWSKSERLDFGQQSRWLGDQPDFPDMLRFISEVAEKAEFEAIATGSRPRSGRSRPSRCSVVACTMRLPERARTAEPSA